MNKVIFAIILTGMSFQDASFGGPLNKDLKDLKRRYETCMIGVVVSVIDKSGVKRRTMRVTDVLWARNRPRDESIWYVLPNTKHFKIGAQVVCLFDYDIYGARIVSLVNKDGTVALGENLVISIAELRKRFRVRKERNPPASEDK